MPSSPIRRWILPLSVAWCGAVAVFLPLDLESVMRFVRLQPAAILIPALTLHYLLCAPTVLEILALAVPAARRWRDERYSSAVSGTFVLCLLLGGGLVFLARGGLGELV